VVWKLTDGVIAEIVGDEVVVMTKDGSAIRLSGDVAESMRQMLSDPSSLSECDGARLESTGVVESATPGVSRRGVLVGGAATLGAGIAALSMPVAAAASSVAGVWGDYGAVPDSRYRDSRYNTDFVEVWVYVAKSVYNNYRVVGGYPESAAWPSDLNPQGNWSLLFAGKSLSLETIEDPEEGILHFEYSRPKLEENGDLVEGWSQEIYDFLKDDWAAKKTIHLSVTNGEVTVPVSLYPYPWLDPNFEGNGTETQTFSLDGSGTNQKIRHRR